MTKDEIKARIEGCKAELEGLRSGVGESSQPAVDGNARHEHLEREIASLEAALAES